MGLSSTIIYTSEIILCSTICVPSATRHNIHMYPSFKVFYKTLAYVYQLELQVMKSNNKESSHNLKWRKYIDKLEQCKTFDFS